MKRPTTDDMKRSAGTLKPSRTRATPEVHRKAPPMPSELTAGAQAVWKRLVPELLERGTISELDGDILALYSTLWSLFLAEPEKFTQPALLAQLRMLQVELGLTPASRARVPVLDDPPAAPAKPDGKRVVSIAGILASTKAEADAKRNQSWPTTKKEST